MAFDDPIVWILIIAVVVFLFGANRIPQFAKAIGQARKEFSAASKEITNPSPDPVVVQPTILSPPVMAQSPQPATTQAADPLLAAAQKEGIDTQGKTREQIATELAWKLKSK